MAEYWRLIFQMAWDEDAAERARREEAAEHGGQDVLQKIRLKIEWTRVCLPARERHHASNTSGVDGRAERTMGSPKLIGFSYA